MVVVLAVAAAADRPIPLGAGRLQFSLLSTPEGIIDGRSHEVYRWDGQSLRDAAGHVSPVTTTPEGQREAVVDLPAGDYTLVASWGSTGCASGLPFHITAGRQFDEVFVPISYAGPGPPPGAGAGRLQQRFPLP